MAYEVKVKKDKIEIMENDRKKFRIEKKQTSKYFIVTILSQRR